MASKRLLFLACMASAASLTACSGYYAPDWPAQYWQRASVSESVYVRGQKAQQMLNRDIGRCVTQLKELERLGVLKNSVPVGKDGRVLDPDELEVMNWDTPERERYLFAEHTNYHDFESCMLAGGWERIEHVPYDVAVEARDVYLQEQIDYRYRSKLGVTDRHGKKITTQEVGDFSGVNQ